MERLEDNLVNKIGCDTPIIVKNIKKIEERLYYDVLWEINTDIGSFTIKTYDGINEKDMLQKCNTIRTLQELNDLQPRCFYYD